MNITQQIAQEIKKADNRARVDYVEVFDDVEPVDRVKARQRKSKAAVNRVNRGLIINKLQSWGEWSVKTGIKTPTKIYNPDDEVIAEGHDHALLTDFDSAMIVIDMAVMELHKIDRVMLELEYKREYKDPLKQWNNVMMLSRTQKTYDNRLNDLLLDNRIVEACGYKVANND